MPGLMEGSYNYMDLAKKYGNFHIPTVKIKVGGTEVTGNGNMVIGNVQVSLSLESASSVSFTVSEVYDVKNRCFPDKVKKQFALSGKVEVELGYSSSTTLVFKGFIAALTYQFQSVPELKVTAMDARRLMMLSSNEKRYHEKENYSDIVSNILDGYSGLCSKEIDPTKDQIKGKVAQEANDYQYITDVLINGGKAKREFFIMAGVAYFREPKKNTGEVLTLTYGESLFSFSRNVTYLSMEVEVVGKDKASKMKVKSEDGVKELAGNPLKTSVIDMSEDGQGNLETRAKAIAEQKKDKSRTAGGSCIGLPEVVPGRFIKLEKLDSDLDGKYYIVSVEHSIGRDGFQTNFEIKGW